MRRASLHLLAHCPAFELPRLMTFNNQELDLTLIAKIDLDKLIYFIKTTKIGRMITTAENQI